MASAYYLNVFVPLYKDRIAAPRMRELRHWCRVLDHVAKDEFGNAADVIAQRIKAVEKAFVDNSWTQATHLELIEPDGATLLDKSEDLMLVREAELELKVRGPARAPWYDGKGKGKKGQGKDYQWGKGKKGKSKEGE